LVTTLPDKTFWAYANIIFEGLIVFVIPLGFAVRELVLLRRDARGRVPPPGAAAEPAPPATASLARPDRP
jgi:hypothetical protein